MTEHNGNPSVEGLAGEIAAELRRVGHWQGGGGGKGERCVATTDAYVGVRQTVPYAFSTVLDELASRLCGTHDLIVLYAWNDTTPTAHVLAALDSIAASGDVVAEATRALTVTT